MDTRSTSPDLLAFIVAILLLAPTATLPAAAQQPIAATTRPHPPSAMVEWALPWTDSFPGELSLRPATRPAQAALPPVAVLGPHFVAGGQRIRFWGVNTCFSANFPEHADADRVAARLAGLGFNCVRLHHMDMMPYPGGIFADKTLTHLDDTALDRLDYLIAALSRQGIYVDLNLHVSRRYPRPDATPAQKGLPDYDKIVDLFYPEFITAQKQYARDLLGHLNRYTGRKYAEEPAIALVEINNENTMFLWGGAQKIAALPEPFAGVLRQRWCDWLAGHYANRDALERAWAAGGEPGGLEKDEDAARNNVAIWKPGIVQSNPRRRDWFDFLQTIDAAYFTDMRRFLRDEIGVRCPITGTIGLGPLGTRSQANMDFVDAHAYWDHPRFPHKPWDHADWLINNRPMVENPAGATLWTLAATHVAGMPFTVTEYNHAAPNEWQAECMPMIAAHAALQDWDAVFLFAYSHNTKFEKPHTESFFDVEGNPIQVAGAPLAARLFLNQAIRPLAAEQRITVMRDQMLDAMPGSYYRIWEFARGALRMTPELAATHRISLDFGLPNRAPPASAPTASVKSASKLVFQGGGQGSFAGQFCASDDGGAAFVGFRSDQPIDVGPMRIERLDVPFAAIMAVPSSPGETLESASRIFISAIARAETAEVGWNAARTTVGEQWGKGPPRVEIVGGEISLPAGNGRCAAWALNPDGTRRERIDVAINASRVTLTLGKVPSLWYEFTREP